MSKKTIEQEINEFLEWWDYDQISEFFRYIEPLIELYDITEDKDWVADKVGEEDTRNVRLISTVYIISKMCETFGGRFININTRFKGLHKRLEAQGVVVEKEKAGV